MKTVFIQPKTIFGNTWEALNIGYLASFLKAHGDYKIGFFSGFFDTDREIIKGCRDADIIGFSCTSPQLEHALKLAKEIKKPDNWLVFGGAHASALPKETLKNEFVDAVVVGEGEKAMLDIANGNRQSIVHCPFIQDLDNLPFPDRKLIKQERNILQAFKDNGIRIASVFSSRGCPFNCSFCASHSIWGRKARFRSPENVLDEIEQIVEELKIDFIKFSDDTFGLRKGWVKRFCEEKKKRGIATPWGCNLRADMADEETLLEMKKANCEEVWTGVESGSQKILYDMKKNITVKKVEKAFEISKKVGLFRRAYVLLGMPNESPNDIKLTEKLIDRIKPDMVGFTILAPYPGTEFYNPKTHAKTDWSKVDEYSNDITRTNYLSNKEIKEEQKRLVEKYREVIAFRHKTKNEKKDERI